MKNDNNMIEMFMGDLLKFGWKWAVRIAIAWAIFFVAVGIDRHFITGYDNVGVKPGWNTAYTKEQAGQGCIYVKC